MTGKLATFQNADMSLEPCVSVPGVLQGIHRRLLGPDSLPHDISLRDAHLLYHAIRGKLCGFTQSGHKEWRHDLPLVCDPKPKPKA